MSAESEHHIVPVSLFFKVFIALVILTILTVAVSRVDLGAWNMVVALLVATLKASLVVLFFMHLKYEDILTWTYAFFPLFLLVLMIGLVFLDNPYRYDPKHNKSLEQIILEHRQKASNNGHHLESKSH